MLISLFQLLNYKSHLDSGKIRLFPGINIIVGQNNSGKSALIEGLGLQFGNKPYRDSTRVLTAPRQREQESSAIVHFTVKKDELWEILRNIPYDFYIPLPEPGCLIEQYSHLKPEGITEIDAARFYIEELLDRPEFIFQVSYQTKDKPKLAHLPMEAMGVKLIVFPVLLECQVGGSFDKRIYIRCRIGDDDKVILDEEDKIWDEALKPGTAFERRTPVILRDHRNDMDFGLEIAKILQKRIYLFHAQRMVKSKSVQEYDTDLKPDASNLASVLANIYKTPAVFRKINEQLRVILPQIHEVAFRPVPPTYPGPDADKGFYEIVVYQREGVSALDAISLEDCGTGVGQVLAILTIIIASEHPSTLIIDEPQSFLHPGAIRKMVDVFKQYPKHQYIISSHSPQVMAASNPSTILLVSKEPGNPSTLQTISHSQQNDLLLCLKSLGAQLSDIFGADQVLWVEGKTEFTCFPIIVEKLMGIPLLGTSIAYVDPIGDLSGRDANRVIKLYERLSEGVGVIPQTLGFVFDREDKTAKEIEDLERRLGRERVKVLDRMMVENYFLDDEAICAVLQGECDKADTKKAIEILNKILEGDPLDQMEIRRYYPIGVQEGIAKNLSAVHAAHVLEDIFSESTGGLYTYDKVKHGQCFTNWLIDNKPDLLSKIVSILKKFLLPDQ